MLNLKDVYTCNECGKGAARPCLYSDLYSNGFDKDILTCPDRSSTKIAKFEKTNKYKIVEVEQSAPTKGISKDAADLLRELTKLAPPITEKLIPFEQTPNCAICRWKEDELVILQVGNLQEFDALSSMNCTAIGNGDCEDVYNSKECQKLFEPISKPTAGET